MLATHMVRVRFRLLTVGIRSSRIRDPNFKGQNTAIGCEGILRPVDAMSPKIGAAGDQHGGHVFEGRWFTIEHQRVNCDNQP
jgi:hypothetical protein